MTSDPHRDQPVLAGGRKLSEAAGAVILVHGRGASAEDILGLSQELDHPELAYIAPQAAGHSWYPYSFLAPIGQNEPWLMSALNKLGTIVEDISNAGIDRKKIVIAGFSQGACLASEFAARNATRYGGLIAFSGGLIGPPGTEFRYAGNVAASARIGLGSLGFGRGNRVAALPWDAPHNQPGGDRGGKEAAGQSL